MATLEQIAEGIRRADAAGDADAVRALGAAYRQLQQQGNPVVQNGQEIGSYQNPVPGQPLEVSVNANPQQSNSIMDGIGRFGQSAASSLVGGLQGATMGAYDEIASALGMPIKAAERLITGQDSINGMEDVGGFLGRSYGATREGQQALTQQAYDQAPAAFIAGDLAGSMALGGGMASQGGSLLSQAARPTIAGMAGRGAVEGGTTGFGTGFNSADSDALMDRMVNGVGGGVAGALLGGATGGVVGGVAARSQNAAVPTSEALQRSAGTLYDDARASGISPQTFGNPSVSAALTARPGPVTEAVRTGLIDAAPLRTAEFSGLVGELAKTAKARNVITPEGNVNPTYSALGAPLRLLEEYQRTGRAINVDELLTLRTNIRDAAADPEQKVAAIGMDMLDNFNDYLYRVAPEIEQADNLYWRGKTGELIDKMGELATTRSGQYSQSGMENALRAEARLIERQIIRGKLKGLPPDLVDQIKKLSQGDDVQDFARWASKFGIQNPITMSGGAAAGFATGSLIPALGVWGTAQGAGAVARALAMEKYASASAIARNGGALPMAQIPSVAAALAQASGQQGANVPGVVSQAVYGDPRMQ